MSLEEFTQNWLVSQELEAGFIYADARRPINAIEFKNTMSHILHLYHEHSSLTEENVMDVAYPGPGPTGSYRVSIRKDNIPAFCRDNSVIPENAVVLLKVKNNSFYDKALGVKIRLATETPATKKDIITKKPLLYRLKKRYSITDSTSSFRFDFTIVKEGATIQLMQKAETKYEIEIEYIGKVKPSARVFKEHVQMVAKCLRNDVILLTPEEKSAVETEYRTIINKLRGSTTIRKDFIGPQPISLQKENLFITNPDNILANYSVTIKVDGERYLLFVDRKCQVWLLNNRMKFSKTSICTSDTAFKGSIFDCEVVLLNTGVRHIMLFDCYVTGSGTNQIYTDGLQGRLEKIEEFINSIDQSINNQFEIFKKRFYLPYDKKSIFEVAKDCMNDAKNSDYDNDGLIFTPVNTSVGQDGSQNDCVLGGTWRKVLKWKPPELNTIDFLVMKRPSHASSSCFHLFVGALNVTAASEYFNLVKPKYFAKLFQPPGSSSNAYELTATHCKSGDPISDKMVVECSFDTYENKWVPLRIRFDKTEESLNSNKITANSYENALSIWQLIMNPISEAVIFGHTNIDEVDDEFDVGPSVYYNNKSGGPRKTSLMIDMKKFHNTIKGDLIAKYARKNKKGGLFDVACGKGGDIQKWLLADIDIVVGTDVCEDNISNLHDGAYARLSKTKTKKKLLNYLFLNLDSSKPYLDQLDTISDPYARKLADCIWSDELTGEIDKTMQKFNSLNGKFHIVSCQFALHYFFENKEILNNFLDNVDNMIADGGYFIGTCFDGKLVNNLLDEEDGFAQREQDGNKLWSIARDPNYNKKALGQKITVYVASINQYHDEYLVSKDILNEKLTERGFKLIEYKAFDTYNGFNTTITKEAERAFSKLNTTFVFQKNGSGSSAKASKASKASSKKS